MPTQQVQVFSLNFVIQNLAKLVELTQEQQKIPKKIGKFGKKDQICRKKKKHCPTLVNIVTPFITTPLVTTFFLGDTNEL
jgi:hypothetical protein